MLLPAILRRYRHVSAWIRIRRARRLVDESKAQRVVRLVTTPRERLTVWGGDG